MPSPKPQLLLLHGALGAKDQFVKLKMNLFNDFEILDFNFSGHGGEPFQSAFNLQQFTSEVLKELENKGIEKISIFGYSMGGYVALNLAKLHPEKVKKIFTLGCKLDWTPASATREVKMLNPIIIEEKVPRFAEALKKRHAPNDWKTVLSKTADMMLALGNSEAISLADFARIEQPVTIAVGDLDKMVSLEESQKVAGQLPNGKLLLLKGFKHPIEQIDVGQVAKELIAFFLSV